MDCSISTNCSNAYCQYAANIERGCNCFDGVDNDADGRVDKADSNCATYYGLSFVGEGSDCSIVPPGANTPFDLVNTPITSAQNTADTQSKVSVGDVDGDGIPDAVITSKWNSEIRVVATRDPQPDGTQAGKVKSSFNLSGGTANSMFSDAPNSGPCKPGKLLFEHENLIADIDGDGKAELFGVVSNRGGNPSSPPTCFYLVGFKYTAGSLTPLFKAVSIGTDRPGTFGIADMDGDGKAEIYLRDRIYAAENGKLLASANGAWDVDVTSAPVAANISGDNKLELICGTKIYSIPSLTSRTPAVPASLTLVHDMNTLGSDKCYVKIMLDPIEYGNDTHSSCSVADIDNDGNLDVVISGALNATNGKTAVFYWNVSKNKVSYYTPPDPDYANGWVWGTGRVNLIDTDKDGLLDMFFIAGSQLFRIETIGDQFHADINDPALNTAWVTKRTINDSRSGVLTVTVYDFDNDGNFELVYRDSQELAVVDAATMTTKYWSAVCQSHTYTEGPVIADVNGDGGTDICVPCNTSNSFDINDPIQQQALGQFRLYYSSGNEWLPTRKVWNQPGYFVVNINDDLTLPFPQLDQTLVFGDAPCPNGLPGPQKPLNVFLNQIPYLSANGCPVFPAPDLSFEGDNPDNPGVDSDGDGVYTPAVEVIPPICGNLGISARFNIINDGDLPITDNIPVSFFVGDPTDPGITSDSLIYTTTISVSNLQVGQTYTTPFVTFNGTGAAFRLYIVLNNDGSVLPINRNGSATNECRIDNNIYSVFVNPDPFTTKIEKIQDNFKCADAAPNNGEVRVRIFKGATEVTDYSEYGFQWYTGPASSPVIISGATNYNLTGLAEGDYTAIVTNVAKGCTGIPVDTTIVRLGNDPDVSITVLSHQTVCSPPNGSLQAVIVGDNTGYTYEWFDIALNPLGITGPTANNLQAGNYIVRVSKDGCSKNSLPATVDGPQIPDAQASTLQDVIDCLDPNSGSVTADAIFNGVVQDPANYEFEWYYYNSVTNVRGSILPADHGTGPTRTGLSAGSYQVIITNTATQCVANQSPITTVSSALVLPTASITEIAPQTSCDPAQPNGVLTASATATGFVSPDDFTFEWFKGDNTLPANLVTTVSGLKGETVNQVAGGGIYYTVKVTTPNNCSATEKYIITEDISTPVLTLTQTPNSICDPTLATSQYNGTLTATVTFKGTTVTLPDPNYAFTWYNGSQTTDPQIAVTDNTSPTLTGLNGGNYTAVVTRADLFCVSSPVTRQVENAIVLPVIKTDSIPSTNCVVVYNGNTISNGQITVTTVDGVAPTADYAFLWSDNGAPTDVDGQTTSAILNIQGSYTYTVEVTNRLSGCVNSKNIVLPDNSVVPVVSLAVLQENGICDPALTSPAVQFNGKIGASFTTPSGNATDYKYTWRNVTDNVALGDTPPAQTGLAITEFGGLNGARTYSVIAENTVLGCTSGAAQVFLPNNLALPMIKTDSIASTNCVVTYNGNTIANGQAFVATVDGAAPTANHTFLWSDNGSSTDVDGQTTATIQNIQGGYIYTVQVTNRLTGCRNTDPVPLADASVVPVVSLAVLQENGICDPALTSPAVQFNGKIGASFITPSGNATDYKYTWRNVTDNVALGDTPPAQTGLAITEFGGLNGARTYSVVAENTVLGCTSGAAQVFLPNNLALPVIKTDSIASTNCVVTYNGNTIANGQAFVATVDGAAPTADHTFLWSDNGSSTDVDGQTTATIQNIQGGYIYTVQVTNRLTGCRNTDPVPLADASVVPVVSLTVLQENGICDPALTSPAVQFSGKIGASFITPSGNATDYKYTWRNVTDNVALGDTPPAQTGLAITEFGGLNGARTYSVIAENTVLGCTSGAAQVFLPNNLALPVIETDSIPSTNCVVTYNGNLVSNGQAFVTTVDGTAVGSTTDYFYLWSDDGATPTPVNSTTETIQNIQGGFQYSVQVTNKLTGCRNTHTVSLPDDQIKPVISVTKVRDNVNCDPALGNTGELYAVVTYNGVQQNDPTVPTALPAHYTITWSTTTTGDILAAQPAGSYSAFVVDETLGCTSDPDSEVILDAFVYPDITIPTPIDQTSCDVTTPNGAIQATVSDGSGATFVHTWFSGVGIGGTQLSSVASQADGTTSSLTNRASDDYTILTRNEITGCEAIKSAFIPNNITYPSIAFTGTNPVTICSPTPNGDATPNVSGLSALPDYNYTVYYVETFTGNPYPTDPAVIKGGTPYSYTNAAFAQPPVYGNMAPGYLTALIVDNNTRCESNPETVQIQDNTEEYTINIDGTPSAGFCGGDGGGIEVTVERGGAPCVTCTYEWYNAAPVNTDINFFNNPPDMGGVPAETLVNGEDLGMPASAPGVGAGTYTLIVVDSEAAHAGCGNYFMEIVPFTDAPVITVTETDITKCVLPFDGALEVDVTGTSTFGYTVQIFEGNGPSGTELTPSSGTQPSPVNFSKTALATGQYYVQVTDQDPANLPCPLGSVHQLDQLAFSPLIALNQVVENTSCDPINNADGKVELTATADSGQDPVLAPTDFRITNITPVPVGFTPPQDIPDNGTSSGLINGFGPGAYTITVTDNNSGCAADAVANIPDQPVLPKIFRVDKLDDSYCAPTSNGQIAVIEVGVGGPEAFNNYEFEWYSAPDVTVAANLIYTAVGGGATTGEVYNGTKSNWSFGATPGAGNGNRQYYVRGRRITGSGIGCYTQLEQRVVLDVHKTPSLTLTPFANTSCVVSENEGVIRAVSDIEDDPRDANVRNTGTYTYTWTPDPAGGNTSGVSGIARTASFDITELDANSGNPYTVTAINSINGCAVSSTTVVPDNKLPITLISYTKQNQLICDPDGNITVSEVKIDASKSANPAVYTFNTAADLIANFNFEWYNAADDGDNDPSTFDLTQPLENAGTPITDVLLAEDNPTAAQRYLSMGEGTYYVIARREPGASPGAGCATVPTRIDIIRDVNMPQITDLQAFANTSCVSAVVEGRIELTVNTTSGVAAESGSTYSYNWVSANPDPVNNPYGDGNEPNTTSSLTIPPGYSPPPAFPSVALKDETYTITITNDYSGCTVTGQAIVPKQKYPITLINYTKQDQLICDPDGNITVTQVTIDGSTSGLPVYNYSNAADLSNNFDFAWYDANNDNDSDANTFDDTIPLTDGTNPINAITLSEDPAETTQPFPNMGVGSYYAIATRKLGMVPGAGCTTLPIRINIEDKHINPVITDLQAFANTSCVSAVVEGRIELTVNTTSGVAAESGSTYSYNWVSANPDPVNNPYGDGNEPNTTSSLTIPPGYSPPPAFPSVALKDETYTITITNDYSGCTVTGQAIVPRQKYPITLISYTKQDQLICDPDGNITVTQVTIDGSTSGLPVYNYSTATDLSNNFDFAWYDANNDGDNDANTFDDAIPLTDGTNPINAITLSEDPAETTQPFPNMGVGSYYAIATRKPGMVPGAGCTTLPIRVNIEDKHINPVITDLQAFANTSCVSAVVEGRIELTVNTTSGVAAESGSTYSYNWVSANPDPVANPYGDGNELNTTSSLTIPPGYSPPPAFPSVALKDETYTITVTNDYSGCTVTGQAIVPRQKYPITLISYTKQDQLICDPDGNITVTQVTIDGSTSNLPMYTFNTPADLTANFDFSWYDANNDGDDNPASYNNTIRLTDGTNPITAVALSEDPAETAQPYPNMKAGTYYVLAMRKPGMVPGAGCTTQAVRVDIQDLHTDPRISFTSIPNSSCNSNGNGVVTGSAFEQDNSVGNYAFAWTFEGNPLPAVPNGSTTEVNSASNGAYTLTARNLATGCPVTSNFNLILDQTRSTPNIIDVATVDPVDCNPSASAEVTKITLGSTTNSVLYPPNVPPNNEVTGADLANFVYEWYEGPPPTNKLAATTPSITGLVPQSYYVLVQDPSTDCKSGPKEVVINPDNIVYPVVSITQSQLQISCPSTNGTGELMALADNQDDTNPDYSFIWYNNLAATGSPLNAASTSTLSNLISGDYSVLVTNTVTGCSASEIYIIQNEAEDFYPVLALTSEPRASCLITDGALLVREVGYDPNTYPFPINYTVEIYEGEMANVDLSQPGNVMTNVSGFTRNWHINTLDVKTYTVKITDNNTSCVTAAEALIPDGRKDPVVVIVEDNPMKNCDPARPNGQLSATADNGKVGGYSFAWYAGNTAAGAILQQNNKLVAQPINQYTVRVTNNITGCYKDAMGEITDGRVLPPNPTALVVQDRTHCITPDGWVTANVNGATLNYTFHWSDGTTAKVTPDFNGVNYINRDIGFYTVTARDILTGCISPPATAEVKDARVYPDIIFTTTPSFCEDIPDSQEGNGTAEIQFEPADIVSDEITWFDVSTQSDQQTLCLTCPVVGTGSYLTGMWPGFYQANVLTNKGCEAVETAEIKTEVRPYNLVTRNNDGKNDRFVVDCISRFKHNNVKIFNRSGVLVYEADGYNNDDVVFEGLGKQGIYTAGNDLPVGTYFYIIDKRDGTKPKTGYLELVK